MAGCQSDCGTATGVCDLSVKSMICQACAGDGYAVTGSFAIFICGTVSSVLKAGNVVIDSIATDPFTSIAFTAAMLANFSTGISYTITKSISPFKSI